MPSPVAVRLLAGIVGWNPAEVLTVRLLDLLRVV